VEIAELKTLFASKNITETTLIWAAGMPGWTELGQLKELLAQLQPEPAAAPVRGQELLFVRRQMY
jgi:hypothetical protein